MENIQISSDVRYSFLFILHIAIIACKLITITIIITIINIWYTYCKSTYYKVISDLYKVQNINQINQSKVVNWLNIFELSSVGWCTYGHSFECKNTNKSTCSGKRWFHFKIRILPAVENISSDLTLDAGSVHILLICIDRLG